MGDMKIGFGIPNNQGVEDPNDLVSLAVTAEGLGFNSVWVREHLFHSTYVAERLGDRPYHDALTILTAIACATKTVRLGTSVLVLPWHDPARLGKMVATLDQLSGGRVDLGVGVAVTRDEFENLGVDFATRGRRTDEILDALVALWTQDIPQFTGEFYQFSGLRFSPKPRQKPHPPILIGGSSPAARGRVAARGRGDDVAPAIRDAACGGAFAPWLVWPGSLHGVHTVWVAGTPLGGRGRHVDQGLA